jgi:iron complex transport system substrate-binding protein
MRRFLMFLLLTGFFACSNKSVKQDVNIQDDLGRSFVFKEIPRRVVSLAPSITESIFFIQADSNLAGVTKYCDFPEQTKSKVNVGGMIDPNLEIITKLNPDLIFLTIEGNSQVTYKSLVDLGFKVFVLNPRNVDGVVTTMEKLNAIFKTENGNRIVSNFINDISKYTSNSHDKTYAGFISLNPLISFNGKTFLNDIFYKCGYTNIYKDEKLDYPSIMEEDIFIKDPECLFVFADTSASKMKMVKDETEIKFGKLKSVINKQFFILDENVFTRPGPRILNSLKILSEIMK